MKRIIALLPLAVWCFGCSDSNGDPALGAGSSSGGAAGVSAGGTAGAGLGGSAGAAGTAGTASSGGGSGGVGGAGTGGASGAPSTGGTGGGGGGSCTVADTSGCIPGTTLTFKDKTFVCDKPLSSYGTLPLKVIVDFTPGTLFHGNGLELTTGCAGDSDPNSIDLIVDVRGDGKTFGVGDDAVKVKLKAGYTASIQLTGTANCGPLAPNAHQDGVQLQGGKDITFVDFAIGDYDAGWSTCQGGGGAFFYSGANGNYPQNTDVVRGKFIACNHSLLMGGPATGSVKNASFRSGRTDGSDPACIGYAASKPCMGNAPGVQQSGLTCEKWNTTTKTWQ